MNRGKGKCLMRSTGRTVFEMTLTAMELVQKQMAGIKNKEKQVLYKGLNSNTGV
jgi:hypothetical protein